MPDAGSIVSLGEAATPIVPLPRLSAARGAAPVLVKDEARLPTGSFKARGLVMAVSMARHFGLKRLAMPTNGNAGAALTAYAAAAGMETFVFAPDDTPEINIREIAVQGGRVFRVNGFINDCGRIVGKGKAAAGWFDVSTLKEPYRIEGKKTMGLELVEHTLISARPIDHLEVAFIMYESPTARYIYRHVWIPKIYSISMP